MGNFIVPILWMRKLRSQNTQIHMATKRKGQSLKQGISAEPGTQSYYVSKAISVESTFL